MNTHDIEILDELLTEANKSKKTLRVHFVDDEVYDLTGFAICQDIEEEYPHCTAVTVHPVKVPEQKLKFLLSSAAMIFHFDEIIEVRESTTDKLLFKL